MDKAELTMQLEKLNRVIKSHDFILWESENKGLYKCQNCGMKGYYRPGTIIIPAHLITCEEEQIKNIIE